jgi:two-component sensor histidine kinase
VTAAGIQERVPAEAAQVPKLRAAVARFANDQDRLSQWAIEDVAMAPTEACANVVRHAYPAGRGELRVTAWIEPYQLVVVVSDDGIGINGNSSHHGLGLGLQLIEELAHTRIRCDNGTTVEMRFPCLGAARTANPNAAPPSA